ncbi:glycosyltransferase family 4 protein [Bacillus sp. UNC41MFS5]|uniref:glycosyltransferase family 4 protein n=1 Tax=Bacillus sp. UNC41MFS5 TaxID=1449046 RepID=UPI00047CF0EE|nr:glycosyltransferase family 4 protein [Bacillus sp. UNC41MFS5]
MSKKRIVFVINYFYPDVASIAQLMTDLVSDLQDEFDITVVAAQPGYAAEQSKDKKMIGTGKYGNVKVRRLKLPIVNKLSKVSRIRYILSYFLLALMATLFERKVDIIYSISQPPILGGLIGTIGKFFKRCKHIYNVQDFNPEQAAAIHYSGSKLVYQFARYVDMLNCKFADEVIVVGNDMQETLVERFKNKPVPKSSVINNWTNEKDIVPLAEDTAEVKRFREDHQLMGKFVVMYSGNLGLFYDLENIIAVAKKMNDNPDIVFVYIGEGAIKRKMEMYVHDHQLNNVLFLPYQPKEFLKYSLNAADVHLVVNQKGIKGVSVPSKIYGVMAAGKPIMGVLEQGSEGQQLISNSRCGLVVEPQDYKGIYDGIMRFYQLEKGKREEMGVNGRVYLENHLTKEVSIHKYRKILRDL